MDCEKYDVKSTGNDCFSCQHVKYENVSDVFIESFDNIVMMVHQNAVNKKWWDSPREPGTDIANIHGEVSEAWEGYRHGNPPSDKIPEFTSVEEELADVIIRIMDIAGGHNMRVAEAIVAKMAYNEGRSERHGGKIY